MLVVVPARAEADSVGACVTSIREAARSLRAAHPRVAVRVVVVADASTPVDWAAIDVVLQAEHGPDGLAWLITWDEVVAELRFLERAMDSGLGDPRRPLLLSVRSGAAVSMPGMMDTVLNLVLNLE